MVQQAKTIAPPVAAQPGTISERKIMKRDQEVPVKLAECRRVFGGRGRTWMSAVKRAMGMKGNFILISTVNRFLRENPTWTEADVYRRPVRQWSVKAWAGAELSGAMVTHIICADLVRRMGDGRVRAGRVVIKFAGEVVDVK